MISWNLREGDFVYVKEIPEEKFVELWQRFLDDERGLKEFYLNEVNPLGIKLHWNEHRRNQKEALKQLREDKKI